MMSYVSDDYELGFSVFGYSLFDTQEFWESYHDYKNSVRRKALTLGYSSEVAALDALAAKLIPQANSRLGVIDSDDLRSFRSKLNALARKVLSAKEVETMYPGTTWDFFKQETAKDVEKAKSIGWPLIPIALMAAAGFLIYSLRK